MKKGILFGILGLVVSAHAQTAYDYGKLQMEKLNRGVVAYRISEDSVAVSWRYLRTDPIDVEFALFRNGKQIAIIPARHSTQFHDAWDGTKDAKYEVKPITKDKPTAKLCGTWKLKANAPVGYLDIPLNCPQDQVAVDGSSVSYIANDATMADLDGDGEMEIILKWDPSNSRDNSQSGITNNTYIDAYKLDGKHMWRIDLGKNIRSGAHYTQMMAYDLDGNGKAELVVKTGDGTIDGKGKVIGDPTADHRMGMGEKKDQDYHAVEYRGEQFRKDVKGKRGGFIYKGAEYLTVFEGATGAAIHTVDYIPARGNLQDWGDNYANRSDRYLACVAYLDGQHPSVIMCRGYYSRMTLAAWDFDGRKLQMRWLFDSNTQDRIYHGQGNHNVRVGDVDGDGKDEITYGSCCIDHDGTGLYSTGFGHGDAMHLTSFMPLDDRLQLWDCHENKKDGSELRDAKTGQVLFQIFSGDDVGRCMAADVDPAHPGIEMWSSRSDGIRNIKGDVIDSTARIPINFAVWWDGDLLREMLDHETVSKYVPGTHSCRPLLKMQGCQFNNGSKSNPCLAADILGDWREEIVARTVDNKHLRIYLTPENTDIRLHTFLQEPVYRLSVVTQNVAYNQPTQVGFYFGNELKGSGRLLRGWQF